MTTPVGDRRQQNDWGTDDQALAKEASKGPKPPAETKASSSAAPKVVEDSVARECRAPDKSEIAATTLAKNAGKPKPSVVAAKAAPKSPQEQMYARGFSNEKGAGIEAGVVRDVRPNSEGEFFTVHARSQEGQGSLGATGGKLTNKGKHGSFTVEGLTVKGELGTANPDGSRGLNVSGGATVAGAEGTLKGPEGASVTVGASLGAGVGGSIGIADANKDGVPEYCGRAEVGPVVVGACIPADEQPARREKVMP